MSDLVEFLRLRLGEDERVARDAMTPGMVEGNAEPEPQPWWTPEEDGGAWDRTRVLVGAVSEVAETPDEFRSAHIARHDPARVLAEVEAKRTLLDYCERAMSHEDPLSRDQAGEVAMAAITVTYLALPYAEHPDYQQKWKTVT